MEGDILRGAQKGRLQDEQVDVFAQRFEIVVFGQDLGFWRDGKCDVKIVSEFGANGGDQVGDVVFRVQFL